MSDKPEQQKQPFTEQDGLFAAELVTPVAPAPADLAPADEPPFDPYYDVPPAEDDYYAPPMDAAVMDAPVMEAPAQDAPAALSTGMPAYSAPATSAPEPGVPAAFTAADPLGDFMPPAYRVGGYGEDFDPADPYNERTHSLSAVDPASLTAGLNERQEEAVLHSGSPLLIVAGFSPSPSPTRLPPKCVNVSRRWSARVPSTCGSRPSTASACACCAVRPLPWA